MRLFLASFLVFSVLMCSACGKNKPDEKKSSSTAVPPVPESKSKQAEHTNAQPANVPVVEKLDENSTEKQELFNAPGLFSIARPGKGFEWKMNSTRVIEGINFYYFFCSKDGSETRMILIVQDWNPDIEAKKRASAKANWNTLVEFANKNKYKPGEARPPSLESPIPELVRYGGSLQAEDGSPFLIEGASVFKSRIYAFQVFGKNRQEVDLAIGVAKSLKELNR